jgi:hypothetical protein
MLAQVLCTFAGGIFLLDANGKVLFANTQGQYMLDEREVLCSFENALVASDALVNRELQDAIRSANEQTSHARAIPLHSGEQRWLAHVLPIKHGAGQCLGSASASAVAVVVRKVGLSLAPGLAIVARQFKLTASEVRVLQGVVDVGGVLDILIQANAVIE